MKTMSEEEWRDLLPSEEERKLLDPIAEKYTTQKLRILDEEESRTRLGKLADFLSGPSLDELPFNFANAVKEYLRLNHVVKMRARTYEQYPKNSDSIEAIEAKNSVMQSVLSLRQVTTEFNRLYYQALAEHRVDEGFGKELEDLRATKIELTAQNEVLQKKLRDAQHWTRQLETYIRAHNGNPDEARDLPGDVEEGGEPHE